MTTDRYQQIQVARVIGLMFASCTPPTLENQHPGEPCCPSCVQEQEDEVGGWGYDDDPCCCQSRLGRSEVTRLKDERRAAQ